MVKDHPELPEGHADYAIVLVGLAKYREAMPQFERALAMGYRDPVFITTRGLLSNRRGSQKRPGRPTSKPWR